MTLAGERIQHTLCIALHTTVVFRSGTVETKSGARRRTRPAVDEANESRSLGREPN